MRHPAPSVVILGAGPAGLGAALALGRDAIVLERGATSAGLCRTLTLDGAVFDIGGHSFHTPHPDIRALVFGALPMEEQRRDAWCWVDGEWIAYPFQRHVTALADPAARERCLAGLAHATDGCEAADFDAWLDRRYGRAIADLFLRPYNRKLWGDGLARLATDWTAERLPAAVGAGERFAEQGGRRTPLQADTTVAYPARGGFGAIFAALARRVPDLRLGTGVVRIDPRRRTLTTAAGDTLGWDRLVSTIALPALLRALPDVPPAIAAAMAALEAIPVSLVQVVLEGRGPLDRHRVYCAEATVPGHKIVLNHTSSTWLRSRPRHGIQVEVAGPPAAAPEQLARDVVAALARIGLIAAPGDVRRTGVIHLAAGYPAPTHARAAAVRTIRAWLAEQSILLAGRFAEWAYINADEALHRGHTLGQSLRSAEPAAAVAELV